jgi:hypothetical protein
MSGAGLFRAIGKIERAGNSQVAGSCLKTFMTYSDRTIIWSRCYREPFRLHSRPLPLLLLLLHQLFSLLRLLPLQLLFLLLPLRHSWQCLLPRCLFARPLFQRYLRLVQHFIHSLRESWARSSPRYRSNRQRLIRQGVSLFFCCPFFPPKCK